MIWAVIVARTFVLPLPDYVIFTWELVVCVLFLLVVIIEKYHKPLGYVSRVFQCFQFLINCTSVKHFLSWILRTFFIFRNIFTELHLFHSLGEISNRRQTNILWRHAKQKDRWCVINFESYILSYEWKKSNWWYVKCNHSTDVWALMWWIVCTSGTANSGWHKLLWLSLVLEISIKMTHVSIDWLRIGNRIRLMTSKYQFFQDFHLKRISFLFCILRRPFSK